MKNIVAWDIRSSVQNTDVVDVHILGMAMEQSAREKPSIDNSTVPVFTMHFILSGKGYAEMHGQQRELRSDSLFVCFPRAPITHYPDEKSPWSYAWLTLDGFKVKDYLKRIGITESNPILELRRDDKLRELFSRAPYHIRENPTMDDVVALKIFYALLERINIVRPKVVEQTNKYDYKMHVANAIEYINNNYHDPNLNLDSVAAAIKISGKYLSMCFKKATDQTFTNYIYNKRLSAALTLIDQGNVSVTDIAYRCGFSSAYYFSNQFKKYNGNSPKQCILQRREKLSREKTKH